jgi:hypothetical protein
MDTSDEDGFGCLCSDTAMLDALSVWAGIATCEVHVYSMYVYKYWCLACECSKPLLTIV